MNVLEIATQSPLATIGGLLGKRKRRKAKKKAKRKAKKRRQQLAQQLSVATGVSETQAKKMVDASTTAQTEQAVNTAVRNATGQGDNFLMKDYINLGQMLGMSKPIPTIPLAGGLYVLMPHIKKLLGMGKRTYRRAKRRYTRRRK